MRFTSTRDRTVNVGFEHAIRDCFPLDGGLYVPADVDDLRRWILYTNEHTSYASVAGALTMACINEEFSPIICETIATQAFTYAPVLRRLDKGLFLLELFHGPTGWQRDFGVDYLVESMETILYMKNSSAVFLDTTCGAFGAVLAHALQGKKRIKSAMLFPKGQVRGLVEKDFSWNGGAIYPIEIEGDENVCRSIIREIFADKKLARQLNLTVANTANIGRLLPQTFFYPFAFSRLKEAVTGDIYYAMSPENFSDIVAGLYAWRLAMPVSGFVMPATESLSQDAAGSCVVLDSIIPPLERTPSDPSEPSSLERLEEVFSADTKMMRNLIYPVPLTKENITDATKVLYMKYKIYADEDTSQAYAAVLKQGDIIDDESKTVVILSRNHPSLSSEYIRHCIGEAPDMPCNVAASMRPLSLERPPLHSANDVISVLSFLRSQMP